MDEEIQLLISQLEKQHANDLFAQWEKGGVYAIVCFATCRVYIGRTKCFHRRFQQHLCRLSNNSHLCEEMQADFNQYGGSRGAFSLAIAGFENTDASERHWIKHFEEFGCKVYNKVGLSLWAGRDQKQAKRKRIMLRMLRELRDRLVADPRSYVVHEPERVPR